MVTSSALTAALMRISVEQWHKAFSEVYFALQCFQFQLIASASSVEFIELNDPGAF